MSILKKHSSNRLIRQSTRLLSFGLLVQGLAVAHPGQSPDAKTRSAAQRVNIPEAIENARKDDPASIYFVEQIAEAGAVQAVPMLEEKFERTKDPLDKAHVASALVRLGDTNPNYWDFLVDEATPAVQSQVPDPFQYDAKGKLIKGISPDFEAWAKAHGAPPGKVYYDQMYLFPGALGLLAMTHDARALPLLREGLSSPNYMIEAEAALGLAELDDQRSVPDIIRACKQAPADAARAIAGSLVYFDDPEAQRTVDRYFSKESAKARREATARGQRPLGD